MDKSDDSAAVRNWLSRPVDLIYIPGAIHTKRFEEGTRRRVEEQPTHPYGRPLHLCEAAGCIREMHVCDTGCIGEFHLRARKNVGTTDCGEHSLPCWWLHLKDNNREGPFVSFIKWGIRDQAEVSSQNPTFTPVYRTPSPHALQDPSIDEVRDWTSPYVEFRRPGRKDPVPCGNQLQSPPWSCAPNKGFQSKRASTQITLLPFGSWEIVPEFRRLEKRESADRWFFLSTGASSSSTYRWHRGRTNERSQRSELKKSERKINRNVLRPYSQGSSKWKAPMYSYPKLSQRRGDDDCILPAVFEELQEAPSANHERCPYDKNRREQQKSIPGHRRLPPASSRLITLHFLPKQLHQSVPNTAEGRCFKGVGNGKTDW